MSESRYFHFFLIIFSDLWSYTIYLFFFHTVVYINNAVCSAVASCWFSDNTDYVIMAHRINSLSGMNEKREFPYNLQSFSIFQYVRNHFIASLLRAHVKTTSFPSVYSVLQVPTIDIRLDNTSIYGIRNEIFTFQYIRRNNTKSTKVINILRGGSNTPSFPFFR